MAISTPQITVIVAVYNQDQFLPNLLASLDLQDCPVSYEVIICDDGSKPSTSELVQNWASSRSMDLRYIWQTDHGFRVGRSRNNGIRQAQGELLVFVDGDSWLRPFFLREHWEAHREGRKMVCGGYQNVTLEQRDLLENYQAVFQSFPESVWTDMESRTPWINTDRPWMAITSGNLSVKRSQAVLFDEQFQGWSSEDRDYAYRLHRQGLTVHLLERVGVVHIRVNGGAVDWNPTKGGGHSSIAASLESKLLLHKKYPGEEMAPSLEMVRYCHLDETTDTWRLGPLRKDASVADILTKYEIWAQRSGQRATTVVDGGIE